MIMFLFCSFLVRNMMHQNFSQNFCLRDTPTSPFARVEDVWFWYIRCQKARDAGARFVAGKSDITRPCEPDDIYRIVRTLWSQGTLKLHHLQVLFEYGRRETPPDPRCAEETWACRYWDEALDRMITPLKTKDILDEEHGI